MTETEAPKFVYVSWIASTPEKVFEALTRPDFTEKYWFATRLESGFTQGDEITAPSPNASWVMGRLVEIDRPRRMIWSWRAAMLEAARDEADSRVTFEVEPAG